MPKEPKASCCLSFSFCWSLVTRKNRELTNRERGALLFKPGSAVPLHTYIHMHIGRQRSAQVLGLAASLFVLRNLYQDSEVMSARIEQFISQHYDAHPSDPRRRLARTLVDVLEAFEALDVETGNEIYVQHCAGMTLSRLWEMCRHPSDIDGQGLEIDDEQ